MLTRAALLRLVRAFVIAEVGRLRGTGARMLPAGPWTETISLGDEGLGLDSLERLGAIGAIAEAFDLDGAVADGAEPETVADWLDWIGQGGGSVSHITVTTSGSTGTARSFSHSIADLNAEADHLAGLFGDRRRVVALVPGHHLYGLIWTILLPEALGIPVFHGRVGASLELQSGDLVVGVPEQWQALRRMTRRFPADLCGVTSAGTLSDPLADGLRDIGLSRLIDVYGSSETGAIAMREFPAYAYELLPGWTLVFAQDEWVLVNHEGRHVPLPDHIDRIGDRKIRPSGRRDLAVKIAGHTVWPLRVAGILRSAEGVADIAVRLGANGRLKAFVVPQAEFEPESLAPALERTAAERLAEPERPKAFTFGTALPCNEMGKLKDWS